MLKIANLFLKFIFNQKIAFDKQSFGKTDLDDFLSKARSVGGEQENRVEVEMLQNALDLSEKSKRMYGSKNRNCSYRYFVING